MTNKEARSILRKQLSNEFPALFPRPVFSKIRPSPYEGPTSSCGSAGRTRSPHVCHVEPVVRRKGFVNLTRSDTQGRLGGLD